MMCRTASPPVAPPHRRLHLAGLLGVLGILSTGAVAVPSDYYYCGFDWFDANTKCASHCPSGTDSECPPGERCFADATSCPPGGGGPTPAPVMPAPTPPAPPTIAPPPTPTLVGDDSRMVAFLGNWQSCPPASGGKMDQYTHIVISFAVSYVYSYPVNQCDPTCTIPTPVPVCGNVNRQDLVDAWRAQGKKVLLSFGGAGMGGSWAGDPNYCWEYCFGREQQVVSQLASIVQNQRFDGVDIDYEYFYRDEHFPTGKGLATSTGAMARTFLHGITSGLKTSLSAAGSGRQNIVTHAPMDSDLVSGSPYFDILSDIAQAGGLDFIMPQYYNGIINTVSNGLTGNSGQYPTSALSHFNNLVVNMFSNDPTKVVFGFCITACNWYNMNSANARSLMSDLSTHHSCNGGAFFWVVEDDAIGTGSGGVEEQDRWSVVVNEAIRPSAGCSNSPSPPTMAPVPVVPPPPPPPPPSPLQPQPQPTVPAPTTSSPIPPPTNTPPAPQPATLPSLSPLSCPGFDNHLQIGGCGPMNPCADPYLCCSQWGWCGSTTDFCDTTLCCQHNCWGPPPIVAPTLAPVIAPTSAPVVAPMSAPVVAPTSAPVVAPTSAPVVTPTSAPVVMPTSAPVVAPTSAPVVMPTSAPVVAPMLITSLPSTKSPTAPFGTRAPTRSPFKATPSPVTPSPTLTKVGQPCTEPYDCQSNSCSTGRLRSRVCLEGGGGAPVSAPTPPAPVPAPVPSPTSGGTCKGSGASCVASGECCLGVCKGSGVCK